MTHAYLIADSGTLETHLQRCLGSGHSIQGLSSEEPDAVLREIDARGKPSVLFVEVEPYHVDSRLALIEALAESLPELPVVALSSQEDAQRMIKALRAGARDYFALPHDAQKLAAQVEKLVRRSGVAALQSVSHSGAATGRLYVVMGGQAHEHLAFLGAHLSLALAEFTPNPQRTLFCDGALPAGAGAMMLNLTPNYWLSDAVRDAARCDSTLIDTAFPKHRAGCHVLSLPEDELNRPLLPVAEFAQLLKVCKALFAHTVVTLDGGAGVALLRAALLLADKALVVTDQSILRSRQCKTLLRMLRLEEIPLTHCSLAIENYRRRLGLEPNSLAELLDLPVAAVLSCEMTARIQAINAGEPLFTIAPRDPYCDSMRRLARQLASDTAGQSASVQASSPGLLSRLFS